MNPVAIFVGVLAWGWLWGIWGLLLGVPLLIVVKAVCDRVDDLKPIGKLLGTLSPLCALPHSPERERSAWSVQRSTPILLAIGFVLAGLGCTRGDFPFFENRADEPFLQADPQPT